jgi:hypothetical protein
VAPFPWENDPQRCAAWREGLTGMPIIDAAMRQLNESGWMHNRCRMIVASFLVKDLICDWRWGEAAFMARLVDGDLAANNGGWQWSASSGMDPKPLRIFNPSTQAAKFDPEARYIRHWLPELAHVSTPRPAQRRDRPAGAARLPGADWSTTRSSRPASRPSTPPCPGARRPGRAKASGRRRLRLAHQACSTLDHPLLLRLAELGEDRQAEHLGAEPFGDRQGTGSIAEGRRRPAAGGSESGNR